MIMKWLKSDADSTPSAPPTGPAAAATMAVPAPPMPPAPPAPPAPVAPPQPAPAPTPPISPVTPEMPLRPKVMFVQPEQAEPAAPAAPAIPTPTPEALPSSEPLNEKKGTIEMSERLDESASPAPTPTPREDQLTSELLEQALEASAKDPEPTPPQSAPVTPAPAPQPEPATETPPTPVTPPQPGPTPAPEPATENPAGFFPSLSTHEGMDKFKEERAQEPIEAEIHPGLPRVDLPDVSSEVKKLLQDRWILLANQKLEELSARREEVISELATVETEQRELADKKHTLEGERNTIIKETESWNAKLDAAKAALEKIVKEVADL